MSVKEITPLERGEFALVKVAGAGQWIIISGTATYFLSELLKLITQLEAPGWILLVANFAINVLLFGIAKYIEGQSK